MSTNQDVYTHGHAPSVVRSHATRTVESHAQHLIPFLKPGISVLDVGCGPGSITKGFAEKVTASGSVVGIDISDSVLKDAAKTIDLDVLKNVKLMKADVYKLPFPDKSFDIVHAHQVLQHLGDPVTAVKEMYRVSKKLFTARDADYATMHSYPELEEIELWRKIYMKTCVQNKAQPRAGVYLPSWCKAAGIPDDEVAFDLIPQLQKESVNGSTRKDFALAWSERALESDFAKQAKKYGFADDLLLKKLSDGWKKFAEMEQDGIFSYTHGQVIVRRDHD